MDKPASSLALKLEAQSQPVTASVARLDFPTEETPSSSMERLEEKTHWTPHQMQGFSAQFALHLTSCSGADTAWQFQQLSVSAFQCRTCSDRPATVAIQHCQANLFGPIAAKPFCYGSTLGTP